MRRALNSLLKLGLGGDYKPVVALILNLNFIPSAQLLLTLLRGHRDSINSEIKEELKEDFCEWLTSAVDVKCKLDFKTPQTVKSGARNLSRPSQDTDSDENSGEDQRAPQMTARERIKQRMATKNYNNQTS